MTRPFLPLAAALAAGITCGNLNRIPDLPAQIGLAVILVMIPLFWSFKKNTPVHLFLLFSMFLFGILNINLYLYPHVGDNHILNFINSEKISIEGMICENPQVTPDKSELVVSVSRILRDGSYLPVSGRVLLNVREPYTFHYGDYIRFHSRLRIPRNFQNPGGFDYEKYLRFRGILVRGFIKDATGSRPSPPFAAGTFSQPDPQCHFGKVAGDRGGDHSGDDPR
jgi:competence protein ComEC